ncbi:MAG: hypothetical protein HYU66_20695 [Armatimonadetes bacterium]|nr:hypothetical protein [Armatimonadota bacterium]
MHLVSAGVTDDTTGLWAAWDAARAAARQQLELGRWWYVGPFDHTDGKGFETAYPPESGVDLKARYPGKAGKTLRWQSGERFRDGEDNSLRIFGDDDWIAVYLYRTITSPVARRLPVLLGSDDTLTVWLNGKKLLAHNTSRACRLGDESLTLDLKAGENQLLLKVCQGAGPSGFAFAMDVQSDALVEGIARDWPEQLQGFLAELDWLRQDKLDGPEPDWRAGLAKALALARATAPLVEDAGYEDALRGIEAAAKEPAADLRGLYLQARHLRRAALLRRPECDFTDLLLELRPPPLYSHMGDQYLGRHSRPGPGLTRLHDWRGKPTAEYLLRGKLPSGSVLHPDLSPDGRRVLFSYCDHTPANPEQRAFFIWELDLATGKPRQLTHDPDPPGAPREHGMQVEDFDPCYLPDGGVVFVSTRNRGFGRCHGGRYVPAYVMYRVEGDGSGLRRLSFGEANEWDPSVLPNGRLVYCRWDYINRHDTLFQSLWSSRPDGSVVEHYYGNYTVNPCMISEARAIPGTDRVVATATAHHSYSAGSLVLVDPSKGQDGQAPIERLTPEVPFPETEGWSSVGTYATPTPLSADLYLAAFSPWPHVVQGNVQRANAYGIYLVDRRGGRELIFRDPAVSAFTPLPLRARPAPPALPSTLVKGRHDGTFFVQDVYRSTEPIPPGSVKRLRVVELLPQPTASVASRSRAEDEIAKRVLGSVPVNDDGSVAFRAPAETPLLLQLVDEHDQAVMSMRSQVYLQAGETSGCIGCHEPRNGTPPPAAARATVVRDLEPPAGPRYAGGFSFARSVQPVLDRYCLGCHGLDRTDAGLSLLGTPTGQFSTAYDSLLSRPGLVALAQRNEETWRSRPGDYGARAGKLAGLLLRGRAEHTRLDAASRQRVTTWLDLNAQFYGDYAFQRAERRAPSEDGLKALRAELRKTCASCHRSLPDQPAAALVNVAIPPESRVLQAPLAESAGGWGQCRQGWPDTAAAGYRALYNLVLAATGPAGEE